MTLACSKEDRFIHVHEAIVICSLIGYRSIVVGKHSAVRLPSDHEDRLSNPVHVACQ